MTDVCAGPCFKAIVCMLLVQHRSSAACDVDSGLPTAADADFVLRFVFQVPNLKSDTTGSKEVKAAAKVSKDKVAVSLASKKAIVRDVPLL